MYTTVLVELPFAFALVVAVRVRVQVVTPSSQIPLFPTAALKSVLVSVELVNRLRSSLPVPLPSSPPSLPPFPAAQSGVPS